MSTNADAQTYIHKRKEKKIKTQNSITFQQRSSKVKSDPQNNMTQRKFLKIPKFIFVLVLHCWA